MKKSFITITIMLFLTVISLLETRKANASDTVENLVEVENSLDTEKIIQDLYNSIKGSDEKPNYKVFRKALIGYYHLKASNKLSDKKDYLTIVDFSLSSNKERLWIIDLKNKQILFYSLVAHGKNTGDEYAANFSNLPNSFMSSIGFYVTGEIYHGKHGLSLRLDGQEKEFNSEARQRAVVMHGADYVSKDFIKKAGRLGRSLGCPAIPVEIHKEIITALSEKTCLFIYHPDKSYEEKSSFKNEGILAKILF
ncbi:MAG: murein L,D-transpeptidase catalytic domain family protein [Bacteroidota bacterium]|nr:murein L,D-transpeptidase catalytic domain family protein [Bacteroidota bacterium]